MSNFEYGEVYKDYPVSESGYSFSDGSFIQVHNIFNSLPEFMKRADLLFIDPPWNLSNINTFYTKAGVPEHLIDFESFYKRLFECIKEIDPVVCYVEIGKEHLADFIIEMRKQYKYVTFYNSTYYHRKDSLCYVVRSSRKFKKPKLDGIDEEDIIKWVCANEDYECIGDLCMGRGLVGLNAHINGKPFAGTELNHKRLSVLIKRIHDYDKENNYEA